jgi:hypothetical protein
MKAFISSTVTDLIEYRQVVQDVFRDLGVEYVTLDGVLRNVPETLTEADQVLAELKRSDLMVLIVGHRYGSIEPISGIGWVEAEFRAARNLGKPILAFLADDKAPFPPASIDEDRSRVERFRTEVLSNYLVVRFRSPSDLAAKLAVALTHLIRRSVESPPATVAVPQDRNVRILRLLLSSPGDVTDEREAASHAVFRYNQQEVEASGMFIKLIRWEDMAPQIGPGPQQVINDQIGAYDLFVGIMWNRFGTPTDVAASGTEEEFLAAVDSWRSARRPWITFYFCDRPSNFTNEQQLEQKGRVVRFRNELNAMGVVRKYNSVDDFDHTLFQDLLRIVPRIQNSHAQGKG